MFCKNNFSGDFQDCKKTILESVKKDGYFLRNVKDEFSNNKEIVLAAVKNKGLSLLFASKKHQHDLEVVYEAVKNNYYSFRFASKEIRNNLQFINKIYDLSPNIIKYVDKNLIMQHKVLQKLLKDFESKKNNQEGNTLQMEKHRNKEILQFINSNSILTRKI
ncbi:Domain of unknown function DUF4116 [Flavobacteriaceae bacterium]|jgi:hypothetical protein